MSNPKKLQCPFCKKTMTPSRALRPGKRIECPNCFEDFEVPQIHDTSQPALGILEDTAAPKRKTTNILQAVPFAPPPHVVDVAPNIPDNKPTPMPADTVDADHNRKRIFIGTVAGIVVVAIGIFAFSQFNAPEQKVNQSASVVEQPKQIEAKMPPEAKQPTPKPVAPPTPAPFPGENPITLNQFPPDKKPPTKVELLPPPELVSEPVEPKITVANVEPKMEKPKAVIRSTLPPEDQELVNSAIRRGVEYLKERQKANGAWVIGAGRRPVRHSIGYAALPGLTLLECDVPPEFPIIQKAAQYVRLNCGTLTKTYELALAILFLDRLGDVRDRPLIQSMALRLVAGQHENGGWGYDCPLVPHKNMVRLYVNLLKSRKVPPPFRDPLEKSIQLQRAIAEQKKTGKPLTKTLPKKPLTPSKAIAGKDGRPPLRAATDKEIMLVRAIERDDGAKLLALPYPNVRRDFILSQPYSEKLAGYYFSPPSKSTNDKTPTPKKKPITTKKQSPRTNPLDNPQLNQLMDKVLTMPPGPGRRNLMQQIQKALLKGQPFDMRRDDNSNSQFAMLGLWAARRHGVPTATALRDAGAHYRISQNQDGGWGYMFREQSYPAMSGVGLLGLAMGHGIAEQGKKDNKDRVMDPAIQKGLQKFAWFIDNEQAKRGHRNAFNLYFLWTVERVAVLYSLQKIDGKDWYKWGVGVLLPRQGGDGGWWMGEYSGSDSTIDTCFALLFLKRSNLVRDLSHNLRFYLAITDRNSESGSQE